MNDVCEGIVIRSIDYKDADAILQVLSKTYGKVSFHARGLRKIKSKNANACHLFGKSKFYFNYREQREMQSLKTAENIYTYRHIRENLLKQAIATTMVEMMEKQELDYLEEAYDVLDGCLHILETTTNPMALFGMFLANCLQLVGIMPNVEGCVDCGRQDNLISISLAKGGFVCRSCFNPHYEKQYDRSILKFFRLFNTAKLTQFSLLEAIRPCGFEDVALLLEFYLEYSGIKLQSLSFLKTVVELEKI
ncbi:MAG: DNA repair protein RecO [Breznakia sp.]